MRSKSKLNISQQIVILAVQIFLIVIPCGLSAFLFIRNPDYAFRLVEPGPPQPIGWCFTMVLILWIGLLFVLSWIIARDWKNRKTIINIFLVFVFLVVDSLFFTAVLIFPAILIVVSSPVGKMMVGI